jgi:hypothetical protein
MPVDPEATSTTTFVPVRVYKHKIRLGIDGYVAETEIDPRELTQDSLRRTIDYLTRKLMTEQMGRILP